MTDGPYSSAASLYWQAGWRGIVPLPHRRKANPPNGFTGETGRDPSWPDIMAWSEGSEGAGNIALRLPPNVVGLDVDDYGDKHGGATLTRSEAEWGALPATWRTTSRDDGVSGIRLYRVPEGMAWPGELGKGTEIIQHRHRYAVVWPSIHPEGKTYRWINADGIVTTTLPDVDDLPLLPDEWIEGLTKGELSAATARNVLARPAITQWMVTRPGASNAPCRRMEIAVRTTVDELRSGVSAHGAARDGALRVVRLADEGHAGLANALIAVNGEFRANVTSPARDAKGMHRRTDGEAAREWHDLVESAVNLVTANSSGANTCDCTGQITGLVLTPTMPTTGNLALDPIPIHAPDSAADPMSDAGGDGDDVAAVERTTWYPRDLASVLANEDDDDDKPTILERSDGVPLFYPGRINGLLGESESGKTWVALLAVKQTLAKGGHVVYLDFEDTAKGIVGRLRAMGVSDDDLLRLHYIGPEETLHAAARDDLRDAIETTTPVLIVLDGFNAAMTLLGLDINDNGDATRFSQLLLRPLSSSGAAVVYVDHVPKNREARGKGGIGAQAKRAMTTGCAITCDILAEFGRGMTGKLRLTVDKDRPGHVRAESADAKRAGVAVLESDRVTGAITVAIEAPDHTGHAASDGDVDLNLAERISEYLATNPARRSVTGIVEGVRGNETKLRKAAAWLVSEGYATIEIGARNAENHHLLAEFTVAEYLSTDPRPTPASLPPGGGDVTPQTTTASRPTPREGGGGRGGTGAGGQTYSPRTEAGVNKDTGEIT